MNEDRLADFVDEHLRHLRGEGPAPDLTALDEAERAEVGPLLELIDAMTDTLPASPPLADDPVAIRLGLVGTTAGDEDEAGDAVVAAVEEVAYRFGGAIEVQRIPLSGDPGSSFAPGVMCRSLAETVLVVLYDPSASPSAVDARSIFHEQPELSAVAFSNPDATRAAVVTYAHCVNRLVPAGGWYGPAELAWEPLELALGGHFERSIPRWDAVSTLPPGDALEELAADALAVVTSELDRVASSRVQLPHKRQARDFVTALDPTVFVAWIDGVRTRRISSDQLAEDVIDSCRTASP
ncbi:MAG TPA: hypothetical protein VIR30_10080 [Nocardioides sp.]